MLFVEFFLLGGGGGKLWLVFVNLTGETCLAGGLDKCWLDTVVLDEGPCFCAISQLLAHRKFSSFFFWMTLTVCSCYNIAWLVFPHCWCLWKLFMVLRHFVPVATNYFFQLCCYTCFASSMLRNDRLQIMRCQWNWRPAGFIYTCTCSYHMPGTYDLYL